MKARLRELRNRHGVSKTALAEAVGTSRRTIYAIESGDSDIHVSLARRLADYFGCGMDDLFDGGDSAHTTDVKAVWFAHVVRHVAEEMDISFRDATRLLERSGLAQRIIAGYNTWHTQGYEYIAETLAEILTEQENECGK
jgi:putative transcriptional regulator